MLKLRRSPRFRSDVQLLPVETLTSICEYLDLSSLANLRLVSKAWKGIIDSELVMRKICVREDILPDCSQGLEDLNKPYRSELPLDKHRSLGHRYSKLREQGYTREELKSYWSLLRAKTLRLKGLPFRKEIGRSVPTKHKQYICSVPWTMEGDGGVHRMVIDQTQRLIITTHEDQGGLKVTCMDTGELLWHSDSLPGCADLEYSEGWAATTQHPAESPTKIQIWRLDVLWRRRSSERGVLRRFGAVACPQTIARYRFSFPHLVVLTTDLHLYTFDVRGCQLLHEVAVKPTLPPELRQSTWFPSCVDFDDEYYFVVADSSDPYSATVSDQPDWCLQAFSRQGGELIWSLDTGASAAVPNRYYYYTCDLEPGSKTRWKNCTGSKSKSCAEHVEAEGLDPTSVDNNGFCQPCLLREGVGWTTEGRPVGVRHDTKSESLCFLWGSSLVIFPDYRAMLRGGDQAPYQPVVLTFASDLDHDDSERSLAVGSGMAAFNLDGNNMLVDLHKTIAGETQGSVVCLALPEVEHLVGDWFALECSSIHLTETTLAFQIVEGRFVGDEYGRSIRYGSCGCDNCRASSYDGYEDEEQDFDRRSIVSVFNFRSLGKLLQTGGKKHGIKTLPSEKEDES